MHTIPRFLLLGGVVLAMVACSDDDSPGTGASTAPATQAPTSTAPAAASTLPAVGEPVAGSEYVDGQVAISQTVAAFVVSAVQAYDEQGLDPAAIAAAVSEVYPDLTVSGSAVDASPSTVSIHSTLLSDKDVAGPNNPYVFAVASLDTGGTCTGMVAFGFPTADQTFVASGLSACNAGAVVEQFASVN